MRCVWFVVYGIGVFCVYVDFKVWFGSWMSEILGDCWFLLGYGIEWIVVVVYVCFVKIDWVFELDYCGGCWNLLGLSFGSDWKGWGDLGE